MPDDPAVEITISGRWPIPMSWDTNGSPRPHFTEPAHFPVMAFHTGPWSAQGVFKGQKLN
jgi:hypothetical protein